MKCPNCGGRGEVRVRGLFPQTVGCEDCAGTGVDPDPDATAEYGPHPAGEARWQALQAEIAADAAPAARADDDGTVPF